MKIAIDTNAYASFFNGDRRMAGIMVSAEQVLIPFAVLAELRSGFRMGTKALENEKNLVRFLNEHQVGVLYPDEQSTHHYASLWLQLRKQGTPIPTTDLWIATLVVQYDLVLCSRDRHFDSLPQIPRV